MSEREEVRDEALERLQAIIDIASHVNEVLEVWDSEQMSPEELDSWVRASLRAVARIVCDRVSGGVRSLKDLQWSRKYLLDRLDCIVKVLDGSGSAEGTSATDAFEVISRFIFVDMYDVVAARHEDFGFDPALEAARAKKRDIGTVGDEVGREGVDGDGADPDAAKCREHRILARNCALMWHWTVLISVVNVFEFRLEGGEVSLKIGDTLATKKITESLRSLTERLGNLEDSLYVGNNHTKGLYHKETGRCP